MALPVSPSTHEPARSRLLFLVGIWGALSAWVALAFLHGKSLRNDEVALPAIALMMLTAVLGSRLWLMLHDRAGARS